MYTCMCDWVTLLYSRKWTEHCKPAIMERIKIIIYIYIYIYIRKEGLLQKPAVKERKEMGGLLGVAELRYLMLLFVFACFINGK